ncbi:hypothetical protein [Micromonospora sp. NPDC050200]|uniref:hypothetical protein n=1 Tax=Micromonospora sp. NPDC050200 TaxID=3155664 RepID=UPI0034089284
MSPTFDLAVFSGQHALHAVDAAGALRWRVRHACWGSPCSSFHDSYEEYAGIDGHRHPDWGSCRISADGSTVWAHVRTPLPDDVEPKPDEEWLVLDTLDGRVLGRASTDNAAAGSHHVPHPDPGQMGLSVGEGQDGVPLRWGRWDVPDSPSTASRMTTAASSTSALAGRSSSPSPTSRANWRSTAFPTVL